MRCLVACLEQQPLLWVHCMSLRQADAKYCMVKALRSGHKAAMSRRKRRGERLPARRWSLKDGVAGSAALGERRSSWSTWKMAHSAE